MLDQSVHQAFVKSVLPTDSIALASGVTEPAAAVEPEALAVLSSDLPVVVSTPSFEASSVTVASPN